MKLVGISGKCGSGKTTFANTAISAVGGTKIALADAVKEEVYDFIVSMGIKPEIRNLYGSQQDKEEMFICHVTQWQLSDYRPRNILNRHMLWLSAATLGITYRQLLQLWGSEYRRGQRKDYWVEKGREKIRNIEGFVFVDDIRFPDEVRMIHEEGGMVVRVTRPGGPFTSQPDHQSETALDDFNDFNVMLYNGGALEEYKKEVESIVRWLV